MIPSLAGIVEEGKAASGGEDVEMNDSGADKAADKSVDKSAEKAGRRMYTGTAGLNFKRDYMSVKPLYDQADGVCKYSSPTPLFNS